MKTGIKSILLLVLTVFVWSCNEQPKKANNTEKKVAKTEKVQKKKADELLLENLRNSIPVKADDLEAWMPKTLGGLFLDRTKSASIFGEVQMTGFYERKGDKMIVLAITDAAGPNGEMAAGKINQFGSESESDKENMQLRSVNVKGRMARQDYMIDSNFTTIIFFHKKRFMIHISAHDHTPEATWKLVDELDFDTLDNLIE